jgi:hypothetical protein
MRLLWARYNRTTGVCLLVVGVATAQLQEATPVIYAVIYTYAH